MDRGSRGGDRRGKVAFSGYVVGILYRSYLSVRFLIVNLAWKIAMRSKFLRFSKEGESCGGLSDTCQVEEGGDGLS